jgi:thioredoxin 2
MSASTIIRCPSCGAPNRVRPAATGTPRCAKCRTALPWLVPASTAGFDDEARASVPVLVDLWAPWCGPCHAVAPVLERLAAERAGRLKVLKVNVDEEPALSARFAVQGIPLIVLIEGGAETARLTGALPYDRMRAWLDAQLLATRA